MVHCQWTNYKKTEKKEMNVKKSQDKHMARSPALSSFSFFVFISPISLLLFSSLLPSLFPHSLSSYPLSSYLSPSLSSLFPYLTSPFSPSLIISTTFSSSTSSSFYFSFCSLFCSSFCFSFCFSSVVISTSISSPFSIHSLTLL